MAENATKQPSIAVGSARRTGTRRADTQGMQGMGGPLTAMASLAAASGNHAVSGLLGGGTALPPQVLAEMESRFGQSFADVRIHDDSRAHASAAGLQAKAYTHGQHIVFGAHRFSPHAGEGKRLMAHELAHVVQQRRGGPAPALDAGAAHEHAADAAAAAVVGGKGSVAVAGGTGVGVARDAEEGGAQGALMERAKHALIDKLLNGVGMPPAGSRLGAAVARGMGEQIARELMSKDKGGGGKGALLLGRIAAMGPGDVAQLAKGYLIGLGEGIVSPVTDLFGLAVFAEHMQSLQRDLLLSVLKSRGDLTAEWQSLVNEAGLVKHSLGSVWQRVKDDPAGSLATLLSLPDAIGELAERKAYELGKQGGSSIVASLDTPWAKKEEATAPDLLDAPLAWVESKAKAAEDWALAAPWAQMGSKAGYAVGFVAIQVILFAFTEGIGNAIEEVGVALGKVGNALGRLSKAIGTVAGRVAELVTTIGKGIAFVEEAIAMLLGKALKPLEKLLEPVLTPLGNALKSLRAFLRKLFGVVEKEGVQLVDAAAGKAGVLAEDATRVAPRVAPPPGKPPDVHGPTAKPKARVAAVSDEAKLGGTASEETRAVGPKGQSKKRTPASGDVDAAGQAPAANKKGVAPKADEPAKVAPSRRKKVAPAAGEVESGAKPSARQSSGTKKGAATADEVKTSGADAGKKAAPLKDADGPALKGKGAAGKPAAKKTGSAPESASGPQAESGARPKPKKKAAVSAEPKPKPEGKAAPGPGIEPKPAVKPKPPAGAVDPVRQPFDMSAIAAKTDAAQMLGKDFSAVKLKPGQDALYILRDADGTILKVGKTSAAGAKGRFSVYKRAGKLTGRELELEVYPLQAGTKNAEFYESALRGHMESQGHALPWDNTGQRLGRPGFGTPGEGSRTSPVTRGEMSELLQHHKGDLRQVGKELGVHRRTADLWAKSLGLNPQAFK
jgi:Domain of unknown function (DUF4157)